MTTDPYRREGVGGEDLPPGAYWQGDSIHVGGFILHGSKPIRPPTEEDAWEQWERSSGISRSEYTRLVKDAGEAERLRSENAELRRERDDFGDGLATELQSCKEDLAKCQADRALMGAILEWVDCATKGQEISDFGESHGIVRAVQELRARAEAAEGREAGLRERLDRTLERWGGAREYTEAAELREELRRALAGEKGGA